MWPALGCCSDCGDHCGTQWHPVKLSGKKMEHEWFYHRGSFNLEELKKNGASIHPFLKIINCDWKSFASQNRFQILERAKRFFSGHRGKLNQQLRLLWGRFTPWNFQATIRFCQKSHFLLLTSSYSLVHFDVTAWKRTGWIIGRMAPILVCIVSLLPFTAIKQHVWWMNEWSPQPR